MEKNIISEDKIKEVIDRLLNEETSKVRREDYNRVQFKIDELQNSLNETIKEFRKLEDSIPDGLKKVTDGKISFISTNLSMASKSLIQVKDKIKQHKKNSYQQQVDEKKK